MNKPGLICPICDARLATFPTTVKANLVVKCLQCGCVLALDIDYDDIQLRVLCGNACAWVEPYGWVPEAGCPIHDLED